MADPVEQRKQYLADVCRAATFDRYIPRKFTAASESGEVALEEFRFRGLRGEREPDLNEVLTHPRTLILGEPGSGKSVVSRAAVHESVRNDRVPVFVELKGYRGNLVELVQQALPASVPLQNLSAFAGAHARVYILDGIDEIPAEHLPGFKQQIEDFLAGEPSVTVLATARQAFYVAHRKELPAWSSVFHILDFNGDDIEQYAKLSGINAAKFLKAIADVDASEELHNPFILSIMVEQFKSLGRLSERRSEVIDFMVDKLIHSRPSISAYQQRRALRMLAVALETYARNELTEEEAVRVIRASMRVSETEAQHILDELYASILRRTNNGLAFQMRSYGEYLAAEELQDESMDRIRKLAFLDYNTPNDSWQNTVSYLAELNADVRSLFVHKFPFWMIHSSPAAFSQEDRTSVASTVLETLKIDRQYVRSDPRLTMWKLARFVTSEVEDALEQDLASADDVARGNALIMLGVLKRPSVIPIALSVVGDHTLGNPIRQCALTALVNAGGSAQVPELIRVLEGETDIRTNLLDAIGALASDDQLEEVWPLILTADAMLSTTYYHMRELRSRRALIAVLSYFRDNPSDFTTIRAGGYIEPIVKQLPQWFDEEIIDLCVDLLCAIEDHRVYPDNSGPWKVLVSCIRDADTSGEIARRFFQRRLVGGESTSRLLYVDELLVSIMKDDTARWLADRGATEIIQPLAPYVTGSVREILRPCSGGRIDAQDDNARRYAQEQANKERAERSRIQLLQERLVTQNSLDGAITDLQQLGEEHWPEVPPPFKDWLAVEIANLMRRLNLAQAIRWDGSTLWQPRMLPTVLNIIDKLQLRIQPDDQMILVAMGMDAGVAERYVQRFGLSDAATSTLEHLLEEPPSEQARDQLIQFVEASGVWSSQIAATLREIVSDAGLEGSSRLTALRVLSVQHETDEFFASFANDGDAAITRAAFEILIERGHRATIERSLSVLLADEDRLRRAETAFPSDSPERWISKVRAPFAWNKLAALRERALQLGLDRVTGMITDTLAKIDRDRLARLIRQQLDAAPTTWRHNLQVQALEQERAARIERAQQSPFDEVLQKLRRSTSLDRLLVVCEGSSDIPVFKALLVQIPDAPEVAFDFVGGWSELPKKDPNLFLRGAKEAIVVMDGDNGRNLKKGHRPLTKLARSEERRLKSVGVELRVLQRYGIENYFSQSAIEAVVGMNLDNYFPIPHTVSITEHLAIGTRGIWYRVRKFLAKLLKLPAPSPKQSLYAKGNNERVAHNLDLDRDLSDTDLYTIVHEIADRAQRLASE